MKKLMAILLIGTLLLAFQSEVFAKVAKKEGPELQVYVGSGDRPSISMALDGSFVVAWRGSEGVLLQRYDPYGDPLGTTILVSGELGIPSIAMAQDGSFVITWYGYDGSGYGIFAQRYDLNGIPIGAAFRVNTYVYGDQLRPSVAISEAGSFIIAWESFGQDGSEWGIYGQRYDSLGNPIGTEFQVNTTTIYSQVNAHVAIAQDGSFIITWDGNRSYGANSDVFAQRYDSLGNPLGTEFQVNTFSSGEQWQNSVAMGQDGSFVITWTSWPQDKSEEGVYAQRYDSGGNQVGREFRVNLYTTDKQEMPSVAMSQDGSFVITWASLGQDGSGYGIYAKQYKANGAHHGQEFMVNTYVNDNQTWPAVAMQDTSLTITWMGYWANSGIFAQRYTVK